MRFKNKDNNSNIAIPNIFIFKIGYKPNKNHSFFFFLYVKIEGQIVSIINLQLDDEGVARLDDVVHQCRDVEVDSWCHAPWSLGQDSVVHREKG